MFMQPYDTSKPVLGFVIIDCAVFAITDPEKLEIHKKNGTTICKNQDEVAYHYRKELDSYVERMKTDLTSTQYKPIDISARLLGYTP